MFTPIPLHIKVFKNKVEAINLETGDQSIEFSAQGFTSSRQLIAEFEEAELTVRLAVKALPTRRRFILSYKILIQAMALYEGGLSSIEKLAFMDIAQLQGGKLVIVVDGSEEYSQEEALAMLEAKK